MNIETLDKLNTPQNIEKSKTWFGNLIYSKKIKYLKEICAESEDDLYEDEIFDIWVRKVVEKNNV